MKIYEDITALAGVTLISLWQYERLDPVNIALLYILPILLTAIRRGSIQAFGVSIICIVLFNFLFVPPRFSLSVAQPHYLFTFTIIVLVGQVVAYLASEARRAKEFEISEMTKEAILSSLSHELRTPLSAVRGASSSLLDPTLKLDETQKNELLETINDGSIKMQNLIENLLNMARLEDGKLKPHKSVIDPAELAGTVIGRLDYDTAKKIELKSYTTKTINCDATLLELALSNLLDNAVKYGKNILVEVKESGALMVFEISNDTQLEDGSDLGNIFAKFDRLQNATSHSGVGLGLAICKAVADIHNGKITAHIVQKRFIVKLHIPIGKPHE